MSTIENICLLVHSEIGHPRAIKLMCIAQNTIFFLKYAYYYLFGLVPASMLKNSKNQNFSLLLYDTMRLRVIGESYYIIYI